MPSVTVSDDIYTRYEALAGTLDGFDDADHLLQHIITEMAVELERDTRQQASANIDDPVVARLRDLGYME